MHIICICQLCGQSKVTEIHTYTSDTFNVRPVGEMKYEITIAISRSLLLWLPTASKYNLNNLQICNYEIGKSCADTQQIAN